MPANVDRQWTRETAHELEREVEELLDALQDARDRHDETSEAYLVQELTQDYGVQLGRGTYCLPRCPLCGAWSGEHCGH